VCSRASPGFSARTQHDRVLENITDQSFAFQVSHPSMFWPFGNNFIHGFERTLTSNLLYCMVTVDPADDLLPVLDNTDVQQVSFSRLNCTSQIVQWLKVNKTVAASRP
jgi:hypothetical protein